MLCVGRIPPHTPKRPTKTYKWWSRRLRKRLPGTMHWATRQIHDCNLDLHKKRNVPKKNNILSQTGDTLRNVHWTTHKNKQPSISTNNMKTILDTCPAESQKEKMIVNAKVVRRDIISITFEHVIVKRHGCWIPITTEREKWWPAMIRARNFIVLRSSGQCMLEFWAMTWKMETKIDADNWTPHCTRPKVRRPCGANIVATISRGSEQHIKRRSCHHRKTKFELFVHGGDCRLNWHT